MNLDKYEGHSPGPWKWLTQDNFFSLIVEGPERFEIEGPLPYMDRETNPMGDKMFADARLIAAAPDLLADNKRLREIITQVQHLLGDMSGDDWRVNDALDLIDDYEQSEWQESEEE